MQVLSGVNNPVSETVTQNALHKSRLDDLEALAAEQDVIVSSINNTLANQDDDDDSSKPIGTYHVAKCIFFC